jgi:thioredoxin 1
MEGHAVTIRKAAILAGLAVAIALVMIMRPADIPAGDLEKAPAVHPVAAHGAEPAGVAATVAVALPRLVDIGADQCIPCKLMAPILEELRREYVDRMRVEFVDVWKHPAAGEPYRIRAIPTQIFYDASGRELYRHEGFISKADILAVWRRFGVTFSPGAGDR